MITFLAHGLYMRYLIGPDGLINHPGLTRGMQISKKNVVDDNDTYNSHPGRAVTWKVYAPVHPPGSHPC